MCFHSHINLYKNVLVHFFLCVAQFSGFIACVLKFVLHTIKKVLSNVIRYFCLQEQGNYSQLCVDILVVCIDYLVFSTCQPLS